jgi:hypothetical protein
LVHAALASNRAELFKNDTALKCSSGNGNRLFFEEMEIGRILAGGN